MFVLIYLTPSPSLSPSHSSQSSHIMTSASIILSEEKDEESSGHSTERLKLIPKEDSTTPTTMPVSMPEMISPGISNTGKSVFFFVILVAQSTGTQLFYKLSQRGGKYEYNTMSAMAVVEAGKLAITAGQILLANSGNFKASAESFEGVAQHVYTAYILLALSYAAYNQLIFYVMRLVDPGTFTLFKSLTPGVVALLNFFAFGNTLTLAQLYCIIIQICGIIPVTASVNGESGKVDFTFGAYSMIIMSFTIVFGAFNTVYNTQVIKDESANYPVTVQNGILYSGGLVFNLLFYFVSKHPGDKSFFYGYNNTNVIVLLILNSTVGVTISMVYKYGDAILKTLCQPVVSSILLFLSKILFDVPVDLIKISGAGSVIISTLLYLKLPPPPSPIVHATRTMTSTESQNVGKSPSPRTRKGLIQVLFLGTGAVVVYRAFFFTNTISGFDDHEVHLKVANKTDLTLNSTTPPIVGFEMTMRSSNSSSAQTELTQNTSLAASSGFGITMQGNNGTSS